MLAVADELWSLKSTRFGVFVSNEVGVDSIEPGPKEQDGCARFAKAYLGRKRYVSVAFSSPTMDLRELREGDRGAPVLFLLTLL